jgi:hypothetical protein
VHNSKSDYAEWFYNEFKKDFELCELLKTIIPFSDNLSFRKYGALNISFVNRSIIVGGYSLSNVHSSKDDKIDLDRIDKITDTLVNIISNK